MREPRIIIVSGFSFSGSSAVLDFLLDHKKVVRLPGGECRLFASRFAFFHLVQSIKKNGVVTDDALQACLQFLDGKWISGKDYYDDRIQALVRSLKDQVGVAYEMALAQFESQIREHPRSVSVVVRAAQKFIRTICGLVATQRKAHTIVLDQAVRPWSLSRLRFFPPSYVFLVRRDIRDQLIDRICNGLPEENFAEDMKERVQKVSDSLSGLGKHRIFQLWFEDLVLHRSKRKEIREVFNLSPNGKKNFNPIASRRNIKRYRSRPDLLGEVAKISPDFLYGESFRTYLASLLSHAIDVIEFFGGATKNRAGRISKTVPIEKIPLRHI
jgi:hypothetical protein